MANLIGYLVVVPISFLTHRDLSFKDRGSRRTAFLRYIPTIATGYAANYAMLTSSLKFGANPYLAQTLAIRMPRRGDLPPLAGLRVLDPC